jgi:restriction endonuclease Mrr
MTVREKLSQEIQQTSDSVLEEVLDFLLFLKAQKKQANVATNLSQNHQINQSLEPDEQSERPIWEIFEEVADNLPDEILADLPTDGSTQHDHYLYGSPKQ